MLRFDKVLKKAKSQSGFTIVEVVIAALLMTMTSIGMLGLFNSATQLSGIAKETKEAQVFARTVSERIRALPFYMPYSGQDADVDDYFWGTAQDHGGDITNNNWGSEPKNPLIPCTLITSSKFTAKVRMAYVLDDLSTSPMKSGWIPKATEDQERKDEPRDVNGKEFKIIQYEVKVSWQTKTLEGSKTQSYSYITLMTNTEFEADLGVTSVTNIEDNSAKWGTGGEDSNTVPHNVTLVAVEIKGYGFKSDSVPILIRSNCDDKAFQNVTIVDDQTIHCLLSPDTGGSGKPWSPRLNPGLWTVRVSTGLAYAYGYNAFEIEFPRPVISYLDPTRGPMSRNDFSVTAGGTYVLNLGGTPVCGATIRLVKVDDPGTYIDPRVDKPITYQYGPGQSTYTGTNRVTATFDLTKRETGYYYVEIVNCENNAGPPEAPGNAASADNDSYKFEIYSTSPFPTNMYIIGSSGGEVEETTARTQARHFAYRLRDYTYKILVDGNDLGAVETLRIGINGDPASGTSGSGEVINATNITYDPVDDVITAMVDLKDVSSSLCNDGTTYSWWVYCAYETGQSGYLEHIFQIRNPRPILYKNAEYVSGPTGYYTTNGGFYHNYHSVTAKLTGECFNTITGTDTSSRIIKYKSGNYSTGMGNQTYQVGVSDGGMVPGTPTNNGTRWETQLNLIHCKTGSNNIWVEKADGTTDNNKTIPGPPYAHLDQNSFAYNISVVSPPTAVLNTQSTGAVTITSWFDDITGHWTHTLRGPWEETENASTKARAQRSSTQWWWFDSITENGWARFTLRGLGFCDAEVGTSYIAVACNEWWSWVTKGSGWFSVTNPNTKGEADTDRSQKYVTIRTNAYPAAWIMPNGDEDGRITTGSNNYDNRFTTRQLLPNN